MIQVKYSEQKLSLSPSENKFANPKIPGIPLTIQSGRPSSRSSQRSSGSIGSYGNISGRRASGAPKGVAVSQSRQGTARSAAILLMGGHLQALKESNESGTLSRRNLAMTRYLEQQLEEQKRLLYVDIPALHKHDGLMRKLRLNLRTEEDFLADTFYKKIEKKFDNRIFGNDNNTITITENASQNVYDSKSKTSTTCSGSGVPNTEASNFNGSTTSQLLMDQTGGGFLNPSYSVEDMDEESPNDEENEYGSFIFNDSEFIIGALPTPSEALYLAVN